MKRLIPVITLLLGIGLGWNLKPGPTVSFSDAVGRITGAHRSTDWALLPRVWDAVHQEYVDASIDDDAILQGMLSGLVSGLNDPYSAYLAPKEAEELGQELEGRVEGIGAEIGAKDGGTVIIAPLPDSPAERAGLKAGDKILAINDKTTTGLSLDEAVSAIRGRAGTSVTLLIQTDGADPRSVKITRESVHVDSVKVSTENGGEGKGPIVVVKIRSFTPDTDRELARLLTAELNKKPSAVVIDLRDNPGGFLDTAVDTVSEFVGDGIAVIEAGRDGTRTEHTVSGKPLVPDLPMRVLVNGGSASAAEIMAGALQDYHRARILGTKTFGKGSVQSLERLPNGGELRLTVARWLTPKGRTIQGQGIAPDRVVEDGENDPVLAAALAELRG